MDAVVSIAKRLSPENKQPNDQLLNYIAYQSVRYLRYKHIDFISFITRVRRRSILDYSCPSGYRRVKTLLLLLPRIDQVANASDHLHWVNKRTSCGSGKLS